MTSSSFRRVAFAIACCASTAGAQSLPPELRTAGKEEVADMCAIGMGNMALNYVAANKPLSGDTRDRAETMFILVTFWMHLAPMTDASSDKADKDASRLSSSAKAQLQDYCVQAGRRGLADMPKDTRRAIIKAGLAQLADAVGEK